MFKTKSGINPDIFNAKFQNTGDPHVFPKKNYYVPQIQKKFFKYMCKCPWNDILAASTKPINSFPLFKIKLKDFMINLHTFKSANKLLQCFLTF